MNRSLKLPSSLEGKVCMPWKLSFGSCLSSEINKIISKCINFVEILLRLSIFFDHFLSTLLEAFVISLFQNGAHDKNHENMEKLFAKHFKAIAVKTQLNSSVASHLVLYHKGSSKWINQEAKLISPFSSVSSDWVWLFDREKINEPNRNRWYNEIT